MTEPRLLWVWGVDISSLAVDLAFVNPEGRWRAHSQIAKEPILPARLTKQREQTVQFARAMAVHCPPLAVYVELPTGTFPNPPLMMAAGNVLGALHVALAGTPFPVGIHLVDISSWKKLATGKGNAGKPLVLAWARTIGYQDDRQDHADALAIASLGCHETLRGVHAGQEGRGGPPPTIQGGRGQALAPGNLPGPLDGP